MKLSSYLESSLIFFDLEGDSKEGLIENLVLKVKEKDKVISKHLEKITESLIKREEVVSSAIGEGLLIPHLRSDVYDDVIVAIGIPKNVVEAITPSGVSDKIKIVFLVITPKNQNKLLLLILSSITQFGEKTNKIRDLLKIRKASSFIKFIIDNQEDIRNELVAANVLRYIKPTYLDDSALELPTKFLNEKADAIPVLDTQGFFIGEVISPDVLSIGLPNVSNIIRNVKLIAEIANFEDYFSDEANDLRVGDIFKKRVVIVPRNASLMEVGFLMYKKKITRVYVVEDSKYYGTIFINDIFSKILQT